MNDYKYLITDDYERFFFADSKEDAEKQALGSLEHTDDINYIYKIEFVGTCFYPEPDPVIRWE